MYSSQDHQGTFEGCLQEDVLSVLLGAGLLFLLRWSLDDSTEAVMTAAVQGLNTILTVPRDKVYYMLPWPSCAALYIASHQL